MALRKTLARTPAKTSAKTSGKKVAFTAKPQQAQIEQLEQWVSPSEPASEPAIAAPIADSPAPTPPQIPIESVKMKRLTLDIPETLHRSIKLQAVTQSVSMVDLLRTLLEKNYGNL
jgi:predicted HicB family RNase H-like nuclease